MHILPQTEIGLIILKTRNETFFQPLQHILILISCNARSTQEKNKDSQMFNRKKIYVIIFK